MSVRGWRPGTFASHFRGYEPGPPAVRRWEDLLRAECTFTFQLVTAIAGRARLRRLFGIPDQLGAACGPSLHEREARVDAICRTTVARRIERVLGKRRPGPQSSGETTEGDLPPVGALLDREIDRAIALLGGMAFEEIQRRGWHVQPNHFYWPLNDLAFLRANPQLWLDPKLPGAIDWDLDGQAELVRRLARYSGELADVRDGSPERPGEFVWGQWFDGLDAYAYYGLVRDLRPAHVVEVGVGLSSLLLARAISANGEPCDVTLIDPKPPSRVLGELPRDWKVIPGLVQHVDLEAFARLQPGDILFYDGSHCARTGSDVNWMFFEVLPRLVPGVWIHIHDIFWPRDYGEGFVLDEGLSWNEQYLVQAFLMHNPSYRVRLGAVMLHHYKGPLLKEVFPTRTARASSLWLEKIS